MFVVYTHYCTFSYAVPKEVGKVGTDSPSYVLPVSKRKDGIEAMFSKQREKAKARSAPAFASTPGKSAGTTSSVSSSVGKGKRKADDNTEVSAQLGSSSPVSAVARNSESANRLGSSMDDSSSDIVEIPDPSPSPAKKKAKMTTRAK